MRDFRSLRADFLLVGFCVRIHGEGCRFEALYIINAA
jgi:hypothetical protein